MYQGAAASAGAARKGSAAAVASKASFIWAREEGCVGREGLCVRDEAVHGAVSCVMRCFLVLQARTTRRGRTAARGGQRRGNLAARAILA